MKTVELFVCMAVAAALSAFSDTPERPHDYTPLCYNNPQATPYLKTGLICYPMAFDYDGDGIP